MFNFDSMSHRITLLPGDGIGREVSAAVLRVLESAGVQVEWDRQTVGAGAVERTGSTLSEEAVESVRTNLTTEARRHRGESAS